MHSSKRWLHGSEDRAMQFRTRVWLGSGEDSRDIECLLVKWLLLRSKLGSICFLSRKSAKYGGLRVPTRSCGLRYGHTRIAKQIVFRNKPCFCACHVTYAAQALKILKISKLHRELLKWMYCLFKLQCVGMKCFVCPRQYLLS